jgi:putative dehydrogenase
MTTVGIVGLGKIGGALAGNLLSAGFDVIGFSLSPKSGFVKAGGVFASSIQQVGKEAGVIVFSLPTAKEVKSTVDALLEECREGQIVIDITGYSLAEKREQAKRLEARGVTSLDCEMSGLPFMVENRTAVIFKSGKQDAVDKTEHVFDAMVSNHTYLGEFGSASKMKLLHNMMVAIHNSVAAEVVNLALKSGLDPNLVVETLGSSAAGSTIFSIKAPLMISRDFEQGAGPFHSMARYLERASELAGAVDANTPLLDITLQYYQQAEQDGRRNQDIAAVIEMLEAAGK